MPNPNDSSISNSEPARPTRAVLALVIPCLGVLVIFALWTWASRDELVARATRQVGIERSLLPRFERWRERVRGDSRARVIFFGDSLLLGGTRQRGGGPAKPFNLAKAYARDLRSRGVRASAFSLVHVAFRPIHLYYLLDEVLEADPDLVIIGLNLRIFSPAVRYPGPAGFTNLSRKLSVKDQLELRDVLAEDQLGLLDPSIHKLQEKTGTLYLPEGVRALGQEWLQSIGFLVNESLGLRYRQKGFRPSKERFLAQYAVDPSAHSQAVVAHTILERLREAGVKVLFYVSPVNSGPLESLGILDQLTLAEGIEALRQRIGATRKEWLDLHDRLPPAEFRDSLNHLNPSGLAFVARRLATASKRRLAAPRPD